MRKYFYLFIAITACLCVLSCSTQKSDPFYFSTDVDEEQKIITEHEETPDHMYFDNYQQTDIDNVEITEDIPAMSDYDESETTDIDDTETTDDPPVQGQQNWEMYLTVDNMFDVYFGTPLKTTGNVVGRGNNWTKEYYYTAENRLLSDYMYVATASDHSTAQGFLGTFTNTTTNKTTNTGDDIWEVFPAGAYEETNPFWPDPWPARLMPTQEEVDIAIEFAQKNDLWVTPVSPPGYDNDPSTPIAPATKEWQPLCAPDCSYENVPKTARWIWHETGKCPSTGWATPLAGCNHDEFLVFRVPGMVPR